MDGTLPTSLKHIISNAEYYGPSLFLLGKFNHKCKSVSSHCIHVCVLYNVMCSIFFIPLLPPFLATEVVTVFVFQEPSLLSSLQDNGLTDVMLHALLIKDVSLCCFLKLSLGGTHIASGISFY